MGTESRFCVVRIRIRDSIERGCGVRYGDGVLRRVWYVARWYGVDYFAQKRKERLQNHSRGRHQRGGRRLRSLSSSSMDAAVSDNLYFSAVCSFFAFIFVGISFSSTNFYMFLFFLAVGESFAFMLQAPINAVVLWSVPTGSRPLACALCTVAVHVFGDVPSPPLFGYFLVKSNENWRLVMKVLRCALRWPVSYFLLLE